MKAPESEAKRAKEDIFQFKDPKEYEHLSKKDRIALTKRMKAAHMEWSRTRNQLGKSDG